MLSFFCCYCPWPFRGLTWLCGSLVFRASCIVYVVGIYWRVDRRGQKKACFALAIWTMAVKSVPNLWTANHARAFAGLTESRSFNQSLPICAVPGGTWLNCVANWFQMFLESSERVEASVCSEVVELWCWNAYTECIYAVSMMACFLNSLQSSLAKY